MSATKKFLAAAALLAAGATGQAIFTASTPQAAREEIGAAHDVTTRHGELIVRVDAGGADVTALAAVDPGTTGQVLTVGDAGVAVWRDPAGALPSGTGFVTVSSGTGGVLTASSTSAADLDDALRARALSVSATNDGLGTAAATTSSITLTLPTGAAVTAARADEPSAVLASAGAITRCEVVVRLATVTNSTSTQGLALTIGDDGGSGTLGAGAVLGFRIATNGASDAIRDGSTVVWSNYSAGALTLDGDTWLRMVVGRTGTGAVFTGRGSSRAAVAWTRRWTGDLSTALADNARANVRAALYVSSGTVPTDITADITSITWTDL